MRTIIPDALIAGRLRHGPMASDDSYGLTGAFFVPGPCAAELKIIASDAMSPDAQGWEHVSVSCRNRAPNWQEMSFVKGLFWTDDEAVVQFHPPRAVYINNHPHCLHLWRNTRAAIELPPPIFVGYTEVEITERGGIEAVKREYIRNARGTP